MLVPVRVGDAGSRKVQSELNSMITKYFEQPETGAIYIFQASRVILLIYAIRELLCIFTDTGPGGETPGNTFAKMLLNQAICAILEEILSSLGSITN